MASPWRMLALALFSPRISLVHAQVDDPSAAEFKRRAFHSSEVLGNYLYIDGGSVSQVASENASLAVNTTLSLSLATSWTNKTASFQSIDKASAGAPDLSMPVLWKDETANVLYSWAGSMFSTSDEPDEGINLWRLDPDGAGGGTWSTQATSNSASIKRTASGTGVACNGMGFYLGGYGTSSTDASAFSDSDQLFVPTWLKYNMTSQVWHNDSASLPADLFPQKCYRSGVGVCLPSYGKNGVVMFLGGSSMDGTVGTLFGFDNLTFYDIDADRWYGQHVPLDQGETVPPTRELSCAVAVVGPNGTYDIFMHGGNGGDPVAGMSDTWVLTLPAFRWINVPLTSSARRVHSCSLVGKSQMVVVGGAGATDDVLWSSVDPLTRGLGIIDLPSLSWSDEFDANAAEYTPPQAVADVYSTGGQDLVEWGSDDIKAIFMTAATNSTSISTNTSTGSSGTSTGTISSSDTNTKSTTSAGAIAGGVIGGIALLAIAGTLIFLFSKKKRRDAQQSKDSQRTRIEHEYVRTDVQYINTCAGWKSEMSGEPGPLELSGHAPVPVHELSSVGGGGGWSGGRQRPVRAYEMP